MIPLHRLLPVCAALLSACASLPPPAAVPKGDFPVERERDLRGASPAATLAADGFALEGRLTVRQGETLHHVGISWRHAPSRDEIFLTGPLGQGLAELTRDATGARLLTADRQIYTAPDWEGLAERALGARLPLSDLPRWLAASSQAGDRRSLDADGWRIDVLEMAEGRPTLIELRRDDIEARLRIDSWTP